MASDEELRLVPIPFNDLRVGTKHITHEHLSEVIATVKKGQRSPEIVYAALPAEPPIDRARVLALLRSMQSIGVGCSCCGAVNRECYAHCDYREVVDMLEG